MRTRKEPEVRRREILAAARECFLRDGYEGTTAQDIARAAGVAKGSFFHYFPAKEDVLRTIAEDEARAICARARRESAEQSGAQALGTLLRVIGAPLEMDALIDRFTALNEDRAMRILWEGACPVLDVLLKEIVARGCVEGTMAVRDIEIAVSFFWSILDAVWEIRAAEDSEERLHLRREIGYGLIETLFGMQKGSLHA